MITDDDDTMVLQPQLLSSHSFSESIQQVAEALTLTSGEEVEPLKKSGVSDQCT
jgi:hypothetical protein